MRNCSCPRDGSYTCDWCLALEARAMALPHQRPIVQVLPQGEAERDFQGRVRRLALEYGYRLYHTWNSQGSDKGFPDLVMVRPGRLIFAELKTHKGKLTQEQVTWLSLLAQSISGVEAYCWRPEDWPSIQEVLV